MVLPMKPATSFRVDRFEPQVQRAEEQGKQQLITMNFQSKAPCGNRTMEEGST